MPVSIPHLALPFSLGANNTGAQTVEQSTVDEVAQNVAVLLSTEIGSRTTLPTYGIEDLAFVEQVDTAAIVAAIATWEPRAVVSVAAGIGPVASVTVNVSVDGPPPQAVVSMQLMPEPVQPQNVFALSAGVYDGRFASGVPSAANTFDAGTALEPGGQLVDGGNA